MTTRKRTLRDYGPRQFPDTLGLKAWEFTRALEDALIPPAGPNGRWPATTVEDAHTRLDEIRTKVGDLPDLGAVRAAEALTERLGVDVDPDTIVELNRQHHIREAGDYKGNTLYDGRDLAAFHDQAALTAAAHNGRQQDRDQAAAYLEIRASDLTHLIRAGLLTPVVWVHSGWQRRREAPAVPLFRTGDLDALLKHPTIDWPAIRATPPGHRSPLAKLPDRPPRR